MEQTGGAGMKYFEYLSEKWQLKLSQRREGLKHAKQTLEDEREFKLRQFEKQLDCHHEFDHEIIHYRLGAGCSSVKAVLICPKCGQIITKVLG